MLCLFSLLQRLLVLAAIKHETFDACGLLHAYTRLLFRLLKV